MSTLISKLWQNERSGFIPLPQRKEGGIEEFVEECEKCLEKQGDC